MADWATISSLATAGGTLVLAVATYSSVRAAKRSAELTELALQEQLRPVLVQSSLDDPVQKIMFMDDHWVRVGGGQGVIEEADGVIYLVLSVRNVGSGIGVLQGWHPWGEMQRGSQEHRPVEHFRTQGRDFYIPPNGLGLWQGALRDRGEAMHGELSRALAERRAFSVDLLYSDPTGGQRVISRFSFTPGGEEIWLAGVARHWNLDRASART
ncbi:MAG: hypothetical protein QOK25_535 [Thermoleophilaceae bacterium]|jgi:hypothetical protein|nr:hypothetical protein [Thermoleophilaceae bacterium]